jgi:hypothetical protein
MSTAPALDIQSPAPSQIIDDTPAQDASTKAVGTTPEKPTEPAKPETVRDAIERAQKDLDAKAEAGKETLKAPEKPKDGAEAPKAESKPEVEPAKAERARAEDGKFARPEPKQEAAPAQQATTEAMEAERREAAGKPYAEAPERFLPKAKEFWQNVPNVVKSDVYRVMQEAEAETTKFREAAEAFEPVRQYHELAKQSGTTLDKALERYVGYDRLLRSDPARAVTELLGSVGLTPAQYAQMVLQNPQLQAAQARPQMPQAPQQAQPSPEIQSMREQIEAIQLRQATEAARPMVESFAQGRNDFASLQPHIAKVIGSGIVEELYGAGLTPVQRLEEAYRIAGGRYFPSSAAPPASPEAHSAPPERRPVDPDGQKSIKGAPTSGNSEEHTRRKFSRGDAVSAAMAELGIS